LDTWNLKNLTDYWDQRDKAIEKYANKLKSLSLEEKTQALDEIRSAIRKHLTVLSDEQLALAAFAMSDDLYKAVCECPSWHDSMAEYLEASAETCCEFLSEHGYVIHYVVDNIFEPTEYGMRFPMEWFPIWFQAAGFVYICPQLVALKLMEADEKSPAAFIDCLPQYIDEARDVAEDLIERCHSENRHYFFLDTDSTESSFDMAMSLCEKKGIITIFRNEPPLQGSKANYFPPPFERD